MKKRKSSKEFFPLKGLEGMRRKVNLIFTMYNYIMAKDIKFIKDAYLNNNSFFLKFLLNYKEKYGLIDKTLEEKIYLLEKKRSNTRLLDEIADILRKYVKQQKIRVVDMTLREWDQAPWGWLNRFEKAILALYLGACTLEI